MRQFVLALGALIAIGSRFATAAEPPAQAPMPAPLPRSLSPAAAAKAPTSQEHLDHLRSAAEHLGKAGRQEEANKLLEQIAVIESGRAEELLAEKEKELDALQAEVEQLRRLTRRHPQISLSFQVLQVSRERLKQIKIPEIEKLLLTKDDEKIERIRFFENPSEIATLIEDLRKRGLVNVLAEPTIFTVSGRPVRFHSGGEVPTLKAGAPPQVSIGYSKFGTEVDAVPTLLGDGKVRLEFRLRIAEIDTTRSVTVGDQSIPQLKSFLIDTAAEIRLGQTVALGGPVERRVETEVDASGKIHERVDRLETIVLITPTRVHPTQHVMRPPGRMGYGPIRAATGSGPDRSLPRR